jgi:polyhydroxyalkanoate synthase subunit PhaC
MMKTEQASSQINDSARFLEANLHALRGPMTNGISPISLTQAYSDWFQHLASSPTKQTELIQKANRKLSRLALLLNQASHGECVNCIDPLPQDKRFDSPLWNTLPFAVYAQSFLLMQQWWWNATTGVRGVTQHHEDVVTFATRQLLDMFAPSNFIATNPEVLEETMRTGGMNLLRGVQNWWQDATRLVANRPPEGTENFVVGKNVAITPGKVVFQNHLIELIQYSPQTATAFPEPLLVVPSWIMKYYILDLSPENSMVKYLVDQGHTVFMISWRNPDATDRDLGLNDYLQQGVLAALDAVAEMLPGSPIHAAGYCLGGTLLSIAAAHLAAGRDKKSINKNQLKTISLLASELDFSEPGELSLFIDESEIAYLEDIMAERGYLDGKQMAGAFTLLNSKDLVWSKMIHSYLMGTRQPMTDLMAWNSDATRMPAQMHSEYLRKLYLQNQLAKGEYEVDGKHIALTDIRVPVFAVATERDHVSPWRSVYKVHLLTDTEVTFVLTSGGHNVGIVNPPSLVGVTNRNFRMTTHSAKQKHIDADSWHDITKPSEGSWWPQWQQWLAQHSGKRVKSRSLGANTQALASAPGSYVFEK